MKTTPLLSDLLSALHKLADPAKATTFRNFFKEGPEDIFIGVPTPLRQRLVKEHWELPLAEVRKLMQSAVHEERSLGHGILGVKFEKGDEAQQSVIYEFYLKNRGFIRAWDGVDDSAPYIVGAYLMNRDKAILYELIVSKSLWDRRIALVATWPMIRGGNLADIFKLVEKVLEDKEDLIHKAAGWMLREAGKKDEAALKRFLQKYYARLPRTTLRYAIERFPKTERLQYLKGEFRPAN